MDMTHASCRYTVNSVYRMTITAALIQAGVVDTIRRTATVTTNAARPLGRISAKLVPDMARKTPDKGLGRSLGSLERIFVFLHRRSGARAPCRFRALASPPTALPTSQPALE
jgi:hypothetical protein